MYFELISSPCTFVMEKINHRFRKMLLWVGFFAGWVFVFFFFPNYLVHFLASSFLSFLFISGTLDCQIPDGLHSSLIRWRGSTPFILATTLERLKC